MDFYTLAIFIDDGFDCIHFFTKPHDGTLLIQMVSEGVDDFRIHEWEQATAFVNDRHAHAERGKDAGVFETNDACAHNCQCTWKMIELEQIVADEDALSVERDAVVFRGGRPSSDDNVLGSDVTPAACIHIFQTHGIGIYEGGFS